MTLLVKLYWLFGCYVAVFFLTQGVRKTLPLLLFLIILQEAVSPPVTEKKKKGHEDNKVDDTDEEDQVSPELYNYNITSTVLINSYD
jgi:hypothetical protein